MKRVLVVQQFRPPGAFQDRQRGAVYAPQYRQADYDVRFLGRHPYPPMIDAQGRVARSLGRSLPVKAWSRLIDHVVTPWSDARVVAAAKKADVVLLLKVDSPALVDALRRRTKARIVYDLADTIWRDEKGNERPAILEMLRKVDAITVDNSYGFEFAGRFGPPVYLWPSTGYVEAFDEARGRSRRGRDDRIVVGWIGSHSTAANLYLILESLEDLARTHPQVELRLVGIPPDHDILRRFERMEVTTRTLYSTAEMIDEVLGMDIGLYPMFDLDDSAMHGTTKGVIYMAGGAVVAASPIRDVATLVEDGTTGILARGRDEWTEALRRLVEDRALRDRLRAQALTQVQARHSLEACFKRLRPALDGIAP